MILNDVETKTAFVNTVRGEVTSFLNALENLCELQATYFARTYNTGGADEIIDADITASKITASQLNNLFESAWLLDRIELLMNEQTVSGTIQGNNIMDRIRSDM